MRKYKYLIYVMTLATLLASCSQDEPLADMSTGQTLTISVTDGGYQSESRATENGYTTQFTVGDECGLYIVRNGALAIINQKVIASETADGTLEWVTDDPAGIKGGFAGEKYYLYYPYQDDMTDKVNASATSVDKFFANLVNGWTPANDQSDYTTGYAPSDLMISTGTLNKNQLSFTMQHAMTLAIMEFPKVTYKFTDGDIPDVTTTTVVDFSETSAKPLRMADGTYRLIYNKNAIPAVSGKYLDGKREFSITLKTNTYSNWIFKVEPNSWQPIEVSYNLAVGDYFCKNADNRWYVIPGEAYPDGNVIGIVFYAGQHDTDTADYTSTGIGRQKCHGYVVALTDVHNDLDDQLRWEYAPPQQNGQCVNASTSTDDWQGYSNHLKIREFVSNNAGWEMKHFPAAFACETYGNRTLDRDGNDAGGKYDWQQPLAAPSNTSGWFLPSYRQLYYLNESRSSLSARMTEVKNCTPVDCSYQSHIKWFDYDISSDYWSSTEKDSSHTWYMDFDYESGWNFSKDCTLSVRAILAF